MIETEDKIRRLLSELPRIDGMEAVDAVRLSGELLAKINNQWRIAHNGHDDEGKAVALAAMLKAAASHVAALVAVHAYSDACSTSVMVLYMAAREGRPSVKAERCDALSLWSNALYSLLMILGRLQPQSRQDVEHVGTIGRYIASMLYHYYIKVMEETPGCPYLHEAYPVLEAIRGSITVQSPVIDVLGVEIDPAEPMELFADLLGRARAMGLLELDD